MLFPSSSLSPSRAFRKIRQATRGKSHPEGTGKSLPVKPIQQKKKAEICQSSSPRQSGYFTQRSFFLQFLGGFPAKKISYLYLFHLGNGKHALVKGEISQHNRGFSLFWENRGKRKSPE